ncbi:MAG: hypothetical protein ABIQ11_12370, partial [Saprospiraceae bacterium]
LTDIAYNMRNKTIELTDIANNIEIQSFESTDIAYNIASKTAYTADQSSPNKTLAKSVVILCGGNIDPIVHQRICL